jgi:hypothetical protein
LFRGINENLEGEKEIEGVGREIFFEYGYNGL